MIIFIADDFTLTQDKGTDASLLTFNDGEFKLKAQLKS
jgi:hypothetical protein